MIPQEAYDFCHGTETVTSLLAEDPASSPGDSRKHLFGRFEEGLSEHKRINEAPPSPDDLKKAAECGNWGTNKPSELFLSMYHDVLTTIAKDPMCGMVSPPLLGSNGVVPLTVIAPLVDLCRHMSNCIARAKSEVFLATNYWKHSEATRLITNALKELSRRAGQRGTRVVVKVMYDRGNPKQVYDNHQIVPESVYTTGDVKLPAKDEIPNLDMEVINYHRPVFGTFHSKFMVIDREMALIGSNNIQENDNVEMMVRLEGPIVDSFYDMCLVSWHKQLLPSLPMLNSRAADRPIPSYQEQTFNSMFETNGRAKSTTIPAKESGQPTTDIANANPDLTLEKPTNGHLTSPPESAIPVTQPSSLPTHTADDPHYDPDIASEASRFQSMITPQGSETRLQAVNRHLNAAHNTSVQPTAPECSPEDEMTPFIALPQHSPVPMALVCRKPWGAPNLSSVHVPQNAAFTGALRYATKSVFIQTPNLNAGPLLPEILAAVRRGVSVSYFVCLGYNDAGELLPFQGGTNEMVAHQLYSQLDAADKPKLNIYNYVAKDQTAPVHNKFKQRSCHIKLLIADERVMVQGNGNQDTQSWFHSQEINVMVDSELVCGAVLEGIRRNQNTQLYGAVAKDGPDAGCWVDAQGKQAEGAIGIDPGKFSWAKGVVGAVQRVRGAGGF